GKKHTRRDLQGSKTARDFSCLFQAFGCQIALGVGRAFRILPIDRDPMSHDVQLHVRYFPPRFEPSPEDSLVVQRPEVELGVKLFFEKLGAAPGVANVFAGVAACLQVQPDRPSLKRGPDLTDALPVGMIEPLRDTY